MINLSKRGVIFNVQIIGVKVENLYGIHHYSIKFDESACIKIIHAPNGYGKTTLLKLIDYVMYYRLDEILQIPFTKFQIMFNKGISVMVRRSDKECIQELVYIILSDNNEKSYNCLSQDGTIEKIVEKQLIENLKALRTQIPIHLIRANRLIQENGCKEEKVPAVIRYAKELKFLMKNALAYSAKINEELDRSFPKRLIEEMTSNTNGESYERIKSELALLKSKRNALEEIDLLLKADIEDVEITEKTPWYILKTLQLYIEESQKKLGVFDELAPRIALMREIINKRFTYKKMILSQEEGFVFEVPYHEMLNADKLSSGEQNELILIFELLFKSKVNALILIDEPEISLHIAWQQSFLEDMEKIAALTGVKLIIATHSPDIINGRWDLTTGLEEC
ncbi:AAA family ATPase [Cellulosilyticum ruminicola]|uniref:AAA family ATPase n=1 Tax=Cellulosilyticum ruminicola TaxID=425254 RepID=UPI0006D0D930|nr:AAA family ATPase [Cellulosilyticum ruminicola]